METVYFFKMKRKDTKKLVKYKKEKSDIYSVLSIFSLYFKFTGLATISKNSIGNGKFVYITEKLNILNITLIVRK